MPIQPSQVTSNANSKMLQIERIAGDRSRPTPERMVEITRLCDEFRVAVVGSTANPFAKAAEPTPEPVEDARPDEGWAYPTMTARKPHYFARTLDGSLRSLCGKYALFDSSRDRLEPDTGDHRGSDCAGCAKRLPAHREGRE